MIKLCSIMLTLIALAACSAEKVVTQTPDPVAANPISKKSHLKLGNSIQKDQLTVEFMEMAADSRCPKGVDCMWAGNAQIVLLLAKGSEAQTMTLNTFGDSRYPKSKSFAGYQVSLEGLYPYPANNVRIDPASYEVKLKIDKSISEAVSKPVIIDVRSEKEYKFSHYPKAINLNYTDIDKTINGLNLAKDSEIIVYCRTGRRSGIAKKLLEEIGYTNVTNGINESTMHKNLGTMPKM